MCFLLIFVLFEDIKFRIFCYFDLLMVVNIIWVVYFLIVSCYIMDVYFMVMDGFIGKVEFIVIISVFLDV